MRATRDARTERAIVVPVSQIRRNDRDDCGAVRLETEDSKARLYFDRRRKEKTARWRNGNYAGAGARHGSRKNAGAKYVNGRK